MVTSQKLLGISNSLKWDTEGRDFMKWHALLLARVSLAGLSLLLDLFLKQSHALRSLDVFHGPFWVLMKITNISVYIAVYLYF